VAKRVFRIAEWSVDPAACRIERDSVETKIEPKMMAVLVYLSARAGQVITRQELENSIWAGTVVGYKAVTNTIIKLRKSLVDDARCPRIIETIPKHGYRLIAEVDYGSSGDMPPAEAKQFEHTATSSDETIHSVDTAASTPQKTNPREAAIPQQIGKPSITIKPFEDIGTETKHDRLGDAFTNGIIVALTRVPGLVLVGDESPSMVKSKQMTVDEIAFRFGVQYVLKGGVRKIGGRLRVNAELTEVSTGQYIWAENLDRELRDFGDFFGLQDEIVNEIVTALDVKLLSGEAARIVRKALKGPAALEHYFRGEDLLWRSTMKLELQEAQRLFEETIRLEPESPVGYAAAALAYWVGAISGLSDTPSLSLERAVELAREAISLDDVTGYAHMVLAHVHLIRREFDEAMAEASQAVSDRPSCPAAYSIKASVLTYLGHATDAIQFAQYALRLTPVHLPMYPAVLASAYFGAGKYEEAVSAAKAAIDLDEGSVDPYLILAASNGTLGNTQEARWGAEKILKLKPDFSLTEFAASQPYKNQQQLDHLLDQLRCIGL
jgi:TolB-like protein